MLLWLATRGASPVHSSQHEQPPLAQCAVHRMINRKSEEVVSKFIQHPDPLSAQRTLGGGQKNLSAPNHQACKRLRVSMFAALRGILEEACPDGAESTWAG